MKGRPRHYEDPKIAQDYGRRYADGWARWKHNRKERLLQAWIGAANPNRVLEVACGPGRFYGAYRNFAALALDRSAAMLAEFRAAHPACPLAQGDASSLPFATASFDVVLSTRFIPQLRGEYRAAVLQELARVSRRHVIIDGRHAYNLRYASRWLRYRIGLSRADKLRHTYAELREELASAGLEVERFRSIAWGLSARVLILASKPPQESDC